MKKTVAVYMEGDIKKMDNLDLGTRMKDYEMRDRYFLQKRK